MSNIIAHIVFDDNNVLKSIEIVGVQTDYKTDLKTIVESGGEKDFYIKISVKQCANASMDCFSLSNGNMYQLDFDDFDFLNHVPIDKLLTTSADSKSVKPILNPSTEGADLNIHRFKKLIVDELNNIKKKVPSKEEKDIFLPKFKQLIVEELNKILPTINSDVILSENLVVEKPAKKLIVQQNAKIDDKINYFIKTGAENKRKVELEAENKRKVELEAENKRKAELEAENKKKAYADADAQAKAKAKAEKEKNASNSNRSGNPIINTDYLETNKKHAVYMLKDSDTLIGKYQYTIAEIDDEHNRIQRPAKYKFEYHTVERLNTVTIASNLILEEYNLINDTEIKYNTKYSSYVIETKKNFNNIIGKQVKLYKDNNIIIKGSIQELDKINEKHNKKITINNKSYKLFGLQTIDESRATYFDSLMFIQ